MSGKVNTLGYSPRERGCLSLILNYSHLSELNLTGRDLKILDTGSPNLNILAKTGEKGAERGETGGYSSPNSETVISQGVENPRVYPQDEHCSDRNVTVRNRNVTVRDTNPRLEQPTFSQTHG